MGEDWVVLKPRATPTNCFFKNKSSPSKVNVGEASLGQSVGHVKYTLWCGVSIHSINITNLKMPYGMYINVSHNDKKLFNLFFLPPYKPHANPMHHPTTIAYINLLLHIFHKNDIYKVLDY
jgi:hypothetical protein